MQIYQAKIWAIECQCSMSHHWLKFSLKTYCRKTCIWETALNSTKSFHFCTAPGCQIINPDQLMHFAPHLLSFYVSQRSWIGVEITDEFVNDKNVHHYMCTSIFLIYPWYVRTLQWFTQSIGKKMPFWHLLYCLIDEYDVTGTIYNANMLLQHVLHEIRVLDIGFWMNLWWECTHNEFAYS